MALNSVRQLFGTLRVAGVVILLASGTGRAQEPLQVPIAWELAPRDLSSVQATLSGGGQLSRRSGVSVRGAPLLVLAGVVVLPALVESLITYHRDLTEGGVLIDASGPELVIRNDSALAYGTVVVRDANGLEVHNFRSAPSEADLSAAIAELAKSAVPRP